MKTSTRALLAGAAIAGLLTGSASRVNAAQASTKAGTQIQTLEKDKESCKGKHDCKGKNACKGKGGCKSGDNGCKGKNSCKGKGGCGAMPTPSPKPEI